MKFPEVQGFQTAFFVDGLRPSNKLSFASELGHAAGGLLDGEPAVFPIPDDMAPEAPRIILKSSADDYRCNVSVNRVDLFLTPRTDEQKSLAPVDERYCSLLREVAGFLSGNVGVRMFRVGVVGTFLLGLNTGAAAAIRSAYFREDSPVGGAKEIQFHARDRLRLPGDFEVNRWVRIVSPRQSEGGAEPTAAKVVIDINTIAEARYNFDQAAVGKMFDESVSHMAQVLDEHTAVFGGQTHDENA